MLRDPSAKYRSFPTIDLPNRQWPSRVLKKAPIWLSTDLRDGNQALANPMNGEKKRRLFDLLVSIGLKEIEVGFPSAGATEFDFIRSLIEQGAVPEDVTLQVLTQARQDLITKSFDSLEGINRAIIHVYNAISPAWRRIVFGMERAEVKKLAISGVTMLRDEAEKRPNTDWRFEYSPETFSTAELDFSLEVCEAVLDVLQPTPEKPLIFNLPATVEAAMPNIYADQVEWFCRNISRRDSIIISVHPHNDRGTGIAAAEMALLAGADRVEGCLFGNGERTGNVDLVTLALNLYTQSINPEIDLSDIDKVIKTVEYCTELPVSPRHPYAGDLVFTAFSGSHQDAIRKGFAKRSEKEDKNSNQNIWEVPYLPIDPADLGRSYEAVIRVNSQSGKGGVAWVIEQDQGLKMPRRLQVDFSRQVQILADSSSKELDSSDIWQAFVKYYHLDNKGHFQLLSFNVGQDKNGYSVIGKVKAGDEICEVQGRGNGLISSIIDALSGIRNINLNVIDYQEHAISHGNRAQAAAYIECSIFEGKTVFGVGVDEDIATASVRAVLSAVNRAYDADYSA
ncbi:MAG: 2-isopropylmalate synthase [Zymomonas mobilis subsp. pomaceae]|uniref:2-isopropylmalate synthase n=1 Tax=Zymomonas mobilis subsp. pomaceae (strain ATCC 29192 / DSM 22645 / JCM 10191 / CCUG 17912 / NBRC 13757 / NCIMB 11200 / NRRL B-4491 / Barker I) TaxID=579138 RepID=F8EUX9_ZYMMT|nr:2-isopropylmalate synthase [Zymomonas mobilis]AEI37267.1 2-isopropylmalate synthase [Zymomonas mobilis subsp. pomaceae ATCC 29192]MDX5948636.1 2-isopropylmalate synthase [Zymomonas mobilis subsp. pomaceae]GEB88442.1 2-isopropylmalate synthase [Zymomonas mobilis subsp. pomaceae]